MSSPVEILLNNKPIGHPTLYNRQWYRSELEAMWAALFDRLQFPFIYEPAGEKRFPDFEFPTLGVFGEVKPDQHLNSNPWNDTEAMPRWIKKQEYYGQWQGFAQKKRLAIFTGLIGNYPVYELLPDGGAELSAAFQQLNVQTFQLSDHVYAAKKTIWSLKDTQ